jgi:hypothetical protein
MKHAAHASTLRQAQGSARTVFEVLTQLVKCPFALSSLRSGRVEGLRTYPTAVFKFTKLKLKARNAL